MQRNLLMGKQHLPFVCLSLAQPGKSVMLEAVGKTPGLRGRPRACGEDAGPAGKTPGLQE